MSISEAFFTHSPLGLNYRNYLIREHSQERSLQRVKDKYGFKQLLQKRGIRTPQTRDVIHDFSDVVLIGSLPDEFVVKPNSGYGGNGVVLLERRDGLFVNPAGDVYSATSIM